MHLTTRNSTNHMQLLKVHPALARRVLSVISVLMGQGWQPLVLSAWIAPQVQLRLYQQGRATERYNFHNATRKVERKTIPSALAVDLVDARYSRDVPADHPYWESLGSAAVLHDLLWDGNSRGLLAGDPSHVQLLPNDMLVDVQRGYAPPVERGWMLPALETKAA